jgi:hypothetical protein
MSARKDPGLVPLSKQKGLRIVACYPRAVKWLFSAAGAPIDGASIQDGEIEILNMRVDSSEAICSKLGIADGQTQQASTAEGT